MTFIFYSQKSKLKCRLNFGFHKYLTIGPIKEEEVHLNPRIVIFYDVISDKETQLVKEMSSPRVSKKLRKGKVS
jgi:prolyl 4-hydroxylase